MEKQKPQRVVRMANITVAALLGASLMISYLVWNADKTRDSINSEFKKSPQEQTADQMYLTARGYETGTGGFSKNLTKAIELYKELATQASDEQVLAQTMLANLYYNGNDVPRDYAEAFRYFQMAASQGSPNAGNTVAYMYEHGQGVATNYKEALRWYETAANGGETAANLNLGYMYLNGEGVSRDNKKAMYEFIAARQNKLLDSAYVQSRAAYAIGTMYEYGLGVPKDSLTALSWYQQAGNKVPDAQAAIERLAGRLRAKQVTSRRAPHSTGDEQQSYYADSNFASGRYCIGSKPYCFEGTTTTESFTCSVERDGDGPADVVVSVKNISDQPLLTKTSIEIQGSQGSQWERTYYQSAAPSFQIDSPGVTKTYRIKPFDSAVSPNTQEFPTSCILSDIHICPELAPKNWPKNTAWSAWDGPHCRTDAEQKRFAFSAPGVSATWAHPINYECGGGSTGYAGEKVNRSYEVEQDGVSEVETNVIDNGSTHIKKSELQFGNIVSVNAPVVYDPGEGNTCSETLYWVETKVRNQYSITDSATFTSSANSEPYVTTDVGNDIYALIFDSQTDAYAAYHFLLTRIKN